MKGIEEGRVWRAALYLRLSREDGLLEEGSIRSQRELLKAFVKGDPQLLEAGIYIDGCVILRLKGKNQKGRRRQGRLPFWPLAQGQGVKTAEGCGIPGRRPAMRSGTG